MRTRQIQCKARCLGREGTLRAQRLRAVELSATIRLRERASERVRKEAHAPPTAHLQPVDVLGGRLLQVRLRAAVVRLDVLRVDGQHARAVEYGILEPAVSRVVDTW